VFPLSKNICKNELNKFNIFGLKCGPNIFIFVYILGQNSNSMQTKLEESNRRMQTKLEESNRTCDMLVE
jgi:hypothetical protein